MTLSIKDASDTPENETESVQLAAGQTTLPRPPALPGLFVFRARGRVAPRTKTARRARIDWYALAVVLLMLVSGAVCLWRLLWAIQP